MSSSSPLFGISVEITNPESFSAGIKSKLEWDGGLTILTFILSALVLFHSDNICLQVSA